MKHLLVNLMVVVLFAGIVQAQPTGKVVTIVINDNFITAYKTVHPDFNVNPDSAFLKQTLEKSYVVPLAYADTARKTGLDKDTAVKRQLELVKKMAEDAYLAKLWQKNAAKAIVVTDAEIKKQYDDNPDLYSDKEMRSFLQARIMDTTQDNIKKVKELMLLYAKKDTVLTNLKLISQGKYNIHYENKPVVAGVGPIEKYLKDAKKSEITGPFKMGNSMIMFVLISSTPGKLKPFDDVKEQCKQNVITAKTSAADKEFRKKAMLKYQLKFSKDYVLGKK